jgi:hypothetical protein
MTQSDSNVNCYPIINRFHFQHNGGIKTAIVEIMLNTQNFSFIRLIQGMTYLRKMFKMKFLYEIVENWLRI